MILEQPEHRVLDGWQHQLRAYHFAKDKWSCMLALGMGTGKSKVTIDLIVNWGCERNLILCPKSVLPVWRRELERHCGEDYSALILDERYGKHTAAEKAALACTFLDQAKGRHQFVVVNYDTARQDAFKRWAWKQAWSCVVADESHRAKDYRTRTAKMLAKLPATRRLCLSGTPMSHSPLDLFGQFAFLDPDIFGKSFIQFRARYAVCDRMFPSRVLRWINQDELHERFGRLAIQIGKEVLDLPPVTHQVIPVELGPTARRHYKTLEIEFLAELDSGTLTVANALVKSLRLRQCTSGFLTHKTDTTVRPCEFDQAKETALSDLIEGLGNDETVVVFCCFRHELAVCEGVAEALGRAYGEVSGERKDLTDHAQIPEGVQVLGVQIQAGGLGVDFTRAAYCVFFSPTWSLGDYDQALARVHRPGQTKHVAYYHLVAQGTIDEKVYEALDKRRDVVEYVLHGAKQRRIPCSTS